MNNMRRLFSGRHRPAWVVLLTCLSLTCLAWYGLHAQTERHAREQFELHVRDVLDSIEVRMRQHEQILLGGVGLFDASDTVAREDWHAYVERLNLGLHYPGIQGVGFSRVIEPAELAAHIASVRREGFPQYTVRPTGDRALYTSIVYLEPLSGRNLAAFGFDMFSEETRARAMRAAVDNDAPAITARVKLVQETHGKEQVGLLMYLPVYRKGMPTATKVQRWRALTGFVYSPYRVDDLMAGILNNRKLMLDFSLYDGASEADSARMFVSTTEVHKPLMSVSRTLNVYGNVWTVRLGSRPELEEAFRSPLNAVILMLGAGISALFFVLVSFLISRREHAEEMALAMTADIRKNEQKLRDSEASLAAILDNVLDGIITINELGIVESFNKSAENIFGYAAVDVIGNNISMLMPEPYHTEHDGYLHNYLSTGIRKIIGIGRQVEGLRRDGSTFPLELSVSRMQLGSRLLFTGVVRDVTERVRIERMKSEFISTVSHELRTPLTSIRGSLGLLAGGVAGELSEQARMLIDIAHKNSERLILLVNDILDMEKIEAGKMDFNPAPVALMPMLVQAIEGNRAYGEQLKVNYELAGVVPDLHVHVDANRLQQVLANLLSNAAKFSPPGDKVLVSATSDGCRVRVAVTDHGSGIEEAFRSQIFQKFAQADASDTRKKGGTGLGLSITRAIVEQMGGSIGFDSHPEVYTTFWVEFPVWQETLCSAVCRGK
ncbi:MAG: CHASE domain-containing protein [Gallionella sp.]|nr:CHASE domain-containing protein [Gallionella sp.]